MKTKVFFLVLVSMLSMWTGFAQEAHYYEAHRHSVTVSTGYPFVLAMMYPPGHQNNSMTMDGRRVGVSYHTFAPTNLCLGYNYQINGRWEASFMLTVCGYIYTASTYPRKDLTGVESPLPGDEFNWQANPLDKRTGYDLRGVIPSVTGRYYWLTKKDTFQMYSAAGIGIIRTFSSWPPVFPILTPVGIRFGSRHWFGVAELTVGTTATGLLAGAGYRF